MPGSVFRYRYIPALGIFLMRLGLILPYFVTITDQNVLHCLFPTNMFDGESQPRCKPIQNYANQNPSQNQLVIIVKQGLIQRGPPGGMRIPQAQPSYVFCLSFKSKLLSLSCGSIEMQMQSNTQWVSDITMRSDNIENR